MEILIKILIVIEVVILIIKNNLDNDNFRHSYSYLNITHEIMINMNCWDKLKNLIGNQ